MKKVCLVVAALVAVCGCAATQLKAGADHVRITNAEPGKECKFLAEATGNQGNKFSGGWTSNENLETGARNDLKNKAAELGGNTVVLLTQRAGETKGQYGAGGQTNVTLSGSVYKCPE